MRNIALRLAYDGTNYHGWQVQKTDVSVAGTVEKALTQICKEPVKVVGCGRTDAATRTPTPRANQTSSGATSSFRPRVRAGRRVRA